jgi:FlaA1/EpsC-like NDP-sugar epimerase
MRFIIRNRNFWLMIVADACLVATAFYTAHLLRFDGKIPESYLSIMAEAMWFIVPLKLFFFVVFNLYRGMWRYTGLNDFLNVVKAAAAGSAGLMAVFYLLLGLRGFSRSIFILDFFFTVFGIAGIRLGLRLCITGSIPGLNGIAEKRNDRAKKKILLIGAGSAGAQVVRELMENTSISMEPVGFLDDDRKKQGQSIHGVRVIGTVDALGGLTEEYDEILITAPSATGKQMQRIVKLCETTGKSFKTIPPLWELIEGRVSLKMVREVSIADVLGRDEVRLEEDEIRKYLFGKRVMITGAGGSIGSELVRQVYRFKPQAIALLDFSEYNLYHVSVKFENGNGVHYDGSYGKDGGNSRRHGGSSAAGVGDSVAVWPYLVDLRNRAATARIFSEFKPHVVFHAAAYKHVPMQEMNPWEAVRNNLLGTKHVAELSIAGGVDKFVLVSSDKAVRPTNVMGTTKRVCELLLKSYNGNMATKFLSVRFGNVIGSSGSVIPLFREQIMQGGPVTVTHPEVTRFFMSIPEAAQLILQAGAMGKGGEIFILEMGEPIRILDLAKTVIRMSGFVPEQDIPIIFTGLRPGEKLYEELITVDEGIIPTQHEKIMVLKGNGNGYSNVTMQVDELISVAETFDISAIKRKMGELVPEYTPWQEELRRDD